MKQSDLQLGDLEIAVLERIWAGGEHDARALHVELGQQRGISLSTIQSTLERLHRKGLLARRKVSHAYVYESAMARSELMARIVDGVLNRFDGGPSESLIAAFAGYTAVADETTLSELERLIAVRKAEIEGTRGS